MRNYVHLGPVSIRVSRKHLASWGYPLVRIGGLSLLTWDNTGRLQIASYHPGWSITWLWFVAIDKRLRVRIRRQKAMPRTSAAQ